MPRRHRSNSKAPSHDRRVKVAVQDSGIDLNHPGIQELIQSSSKWNPDRVVSKSFAGLDDSSDPNGHGTHVTCTIMSIAQGAKLFVGGVVGRDKRLDPEALADVSICCRTLPRWCNASLRLFQAIRYSIRDWDVDIISLSLGFTRIPSKKLGDSIKEALDREKLIFAAVSQRRRSDPWYFVASISDEGIRSVLMQHQRRFLYIESQLKRSPLLKIQILW